VQRLRNSVDINLDRPTAIGMITTAGDIIAQKFELVTSGATSPLGPMSSTQQIVGDFPGGRAGRVAHNNNLPRHDLHSINKASVVGGASAAPAPRLDLDLGAIVGQLHEAGRTREHHSLKRGEKTEGININTETIDNSGQLFGLGGLVKLGFVANDRMDMTNRGNPLANQLEQVGSSFDDLGIGRHSQSTRNAAIAAIEL